MIESKYCEYWTNLNDRTKFISSVKSQMLDGDCFELIDGRTLEMRGSILKEIVGDIAHKKCIVACVIGPQSTGKSTLMNYCFGTQFLASTGRCTQGIYFTLQKIPKEMCPNGGVEYLLILDTEGLDSAERSDKEYDRKIVLFTLLCSDFLIVNSRGDMSASMKNIIKMCTVQYDTLKNFSTPPKILYTFVANTDLKPGPFKAEVADLRQDVIEKTKTDTIEATADELLGMNEDRVRVLGVAYGTEMIEEDANKGLVYGNNLNVV